MKAIQYKPTKEKGLWDIVVEQNPSVLLAAYSRIFKKKQLPIAIQNQRGTLHCYEDVCYISATLDNDNQAIVHLDTHRGIGAEIPRTNVMYVDNGAQMFTGLHTEMEVLFDATNFSDKFQATLVWKGEKPKQINFPDEDTFLCLETRDVEVSLIFMKEDHGIVTLDIENDVVCLPFNKNCVMFNGKKASSEQLAKLHKSKDYSGMYASISVMMKGNEKPTKEYFCSGLWLGQKVNIPKLTPREVYTKQSEYKYSLQKNPKRIFIDVEAVCQYKGSIMNIHFFLGKNILAMNFDLKEVTTASAILSLMERKEHGIAHIIEDNKHDPSDKDLIPQWGIAWINYTDSPSCHRLSEDGKIILVPQARDYGSFSKETSIQPTTSERFRSAVISLTNDLITLDIKPEVKQALESSWKVSDSPKYYIVGGELKFTENDGDCTFRYYYHNIDKWKEVVLNTDMVLDLPGTTYVTKYAFVVFQSINNDDSNDGLGKPIMAWLSANAYRDCCILPNQKIIKYNSYTRQVCLKGKGEKNYREYYYIGRAVFLQTSYVKVADFMMRQRNTPLNAVVVYLPLAMRVELEVSHLCLFAAKDITHCLVASRGFHLDPDLSLTLKVPRGLNSFLSSENVKKKAKKKKGSKSKAPSSSPESKIPKVKSMEELRMEEICRQFSSLRNEAVICMEGQHFYSHVSKFNYGSTLCQKKVHMVDHTDGLALLHYASESQYIVVQLSDVYYQGQKAKSFKELEKYKSNFHCVTTAIDDTVFRDHPVTQLAMVAWVCGGPSLLSVHECDFHEAALYVPHEETEAVTSLSEVLFSDDYSHVPSHLLPHYCNTKQRQLEVLLCQEGVTAHPCKNQSLYKKSLEVTEAKIEYVYGNIVVLSGFKAPHNIWCHISDVYIEGQKLDNLAQLELYMINKRPLTTIYCSASAMTVMQGDMCFRGLLVYEASATNCLPELHMCSTHVGYQVGKVSAYERQVIDETLLMVRTTAKQDNLYCKYYAKCTTSDLGKDFVGNQKDEESAGPPCMNRSHSPRSELVSPAPSLEERSTVDPPKMEAGSQHVSQSSGSEDETSGRSSCGEAKSKKKEPREKSKVKFSQSTQGKLQNAHQGEECSGSDSRQIPIKTTPGKTKRTLREEEDLLGPPPANTYFSPTKAPPSPGKSSQSTTTLVSVTPVNVDTIEIEHCWVVKASPMLALLMGQKNPIVIHRDDFLFRGKKIESSFSLRNFLFSLRSPINVHYFKASHSFNFFSTEVSHFGILAHTETKLKAINTILDTWKQNPIKSYRYKHAIIKDLGTVLKPTSGKEMMVKGKLSRTWRNDGVMSVLQLSDSGNFHCVGHAWFHRFVVFIDGHQVHYSVPSLGEHIEPYRSALWNCTVKSCVPETINGIDIEYIITKMSNCTKEEEENNKFNINDKSKYAQGKNSSPKNKKSQQNAQIPKRKTTQNSENTTVNKSVSPVHSSPTYTTKHPPQKHINITYPNATTTKPLYSDTKGREVDGSSRGRLISASPPLKDRGPQPPSIVTEVKQGVISDLYSSSGVLVGEDGHSTLFFSRDHCYLYGVPLCSLELWHVLTIGLAVKYQVVSQNSVCRVSVCEPPSPDILIAHIAEWCDDKHVPEETAVSLANIAFSTICSLQQ